MDVLTRKIKKTPKKITKRPAKKSKLLPLMLANRKPLKRGSARRTGRDGAALKKDPSAGERREKVTKRGTIEVIRPDLGKVRVEVIRPGDEWEITVLVKDASTFDRVVSHIQAVFFAASTPPAAAPMPAAVGTHPLVTAGTFSSPLRSETSGRLDVNKIAAAFGVTQAAIAAFLGKSASAVSQTSDSETSQAKLACFESVYRLAPLLRNEGAFRSWLQTPNDELGGKTPHALLFSDEYPLLVAQVESVLTGEPV